jgi:pentatricopeptide repeat protein
LNLSIVSYNALLTVYASSGIIAEKAPALFDEMEARGLVWDSFTYTALMMGKETQRSSGTIVLWKKMHQQGVVPTHVAAMELFKACVQERDGATALEALNWLWSLEQKRSATSNAASTSTSTSNVNTLTSQDHSPSLSSLSSSIPSSSLAATTATPLSPPSSHEDASSPQRQQDAVAVAVAPAAYPSLLPPLVSQPVTAVVDVSMCTKALAALSARGMGNECIALLNTMRTRNIEPTAACYVIVLHTLERIGDWQKAVNLLLQVC